MTEHLSDSQVSKKRTSTYLSPNIQNQFIKLLGKKSEKSYSKRNEGSNNLLNFT